MVYLASKAATGTLTVRRGSEEKVIALVKGNVVNANSNEPRERLGQFLINLGHITEDQFNRAFETQQETQLFLGRILVMIGAVDDATVDRVMALKVRETLLSACDWDFGEFAFDNSEPSERPEAMTLSLPLEDLHRDAEFRETAWKSIRGVFPSGKSKLSLRRENLAEPPLPDSLDEKLCDLIEAGHTIDEIALSLHATDFFLYQRLFALNRLEAVFPAAEDTVDIEVETDDHEGATAERATEGILEHARSCLNKGDVTVAYALAKRAHEVNESAESAKLIQDCEAALLHRLRRGFVEGNRVPEVAVTPQVVKSLTLSAPERYLLSKIDGKRNVGAIVHVSPIRELDALLHFEQFAEQGLIRFADAT